MNFFFLHEFENFSFQDFNKRGKEITLSIQGIQVERKQKNFFNHFRNFFFRKINYSSKTHFASLLKKSSSLNSNL